MIQNSKVTHIRNATGKIKYQISNILIVKSGLHVKITNVSRNNIILNIQ